MSKRGVSRLVSGVNFRFVPACAGDTTERSDEESHRELGTREPGYPGTTCPGPAEPGSGTFRSGN
eukprot:2241556-Rhodomonas_salina.1